jgi:hypothetical protein
MTVHITPDTCNGYLRGRDAPCYPKGDFGYFVYVEDDLPDDLPDDQRACYAFASEHQYDWIMFDCDASPVDSLACYDTEWGSGIPSLDQLSSEFQIWLTGQNLPQISAEELVHQQFTAAQRAWVSQFFTRCERSEYAA